MNLFLVYASTCLAVVSAGISEFGGGQSNSGGYSTVGGNGGYNAPARGGGGSSGFNLFGNGGGSNGLSGAVGFGGSGLSFDGGRGVTGGQSNSQFGGSINNNAAGPQLNQQGGQIRRFVSVHIAPEQDSTPTEPRVIRAGGPADTHYNIIFVKAPSQNNQQQTEVVLPEQPKQKTLVYVLIKKAENNQDNVKIRAPVPTKPAKPEVFFIRYKPESDPTQQGDAGTGIGGPAGANFVGNNAGGFGNDNGLSSAGGSIGSSYGPPPQQNGGGNTGGYQ